MTHGPDGTHRSAVAPYGSWRSKIAIESIVAGQVALREIRLDGDDVYWTEGRPAEGGRQVIVRRTPDGEQVEVTPPGVNARTRVHEYGGGSYIVERGTVYASDFATGQLSRQERDGDAVPITPEGAYRYADLIVDAPRSRLIAIREDHSNAPAEAVNTIVAIPTGSASDGRTPAPRREPDASRAAGAEGELRRNGASDGAGTILVQGNDFYSSPRLSPDGTRLAWLTWHHPDMPWDGTELWIADLHADGSLTAAHRIAGGPGESIAQPEWSPDGSLVFVSDRSGWWNLFVADPATGDARAVAPTEAEFAGPQWVFAISEYGFDGAARIVGAARAGGRDQLYRVDPATGSLEWLATDYTEISSVRLAGDAAVFIGGSPVDSTAIVRMDLRDGSTSVLRRASETTPDPGYLSRPRSIEFPTEGGRTAFAQFYAPHNPDFRAPDGERPPLEVRSHGGPTASAGTNLALDIQVLTSRGIAVVDVDYGGSTGYGRAYRERLEGEWGVVDVDDCVNVARYLVEQGLVDGERLAIEGGSASGYTTLCALTMRDTFKAGTSYFGIGDLETFVSDTHKFESRYLDRLVGPYPERRDVYRERSPIHHMDGVSAPMLILQGLDDRVVPPSQAEQMVAALRAKGLPYAYLPFEGEDHGFRKAENIIRSMEAELSFYAQVFGFELSDDIPPLRIEGLESITALHA